MIQVSQGEAIKKHRRRHNRMNRKKTKIYLTDIINSHSQMNYLQIYEYICSQISDEKLVPIKASKLNGKKPALYNAYWQLKGEKDEKNERTI